MPRRAIVVGATGLVGRFLLPRLLAAGFHVRAWSRQPPPAAEAPGLVWEARDVSRPLEWPPEAECLFHAAPLWLLPPLVAPLAATGLRRIVALSSTSRFTKQASPSRHEREVAGRLAEAEADLERRCAAGGLVWTILRPTLVYGGGRDRSVSDVARFARFLGFFPVAAEARGKRQPVHADDLAVACLAAVDSPAAANRSYDLPGGATLTYAEMVGVVFRGLGREPRLVHVPTGVLRPLLRVASCLPGWRHLDPAMADRMNEDQSFDAGPAERDLGYAPRPFSFPG